LGLADVAQQLYPELAQAQVSMTLQNTPFP
jgi:hypothetical protein